MRKEEYRAERQKRGTLAEVSQKLGVHLVTLSRRENGKAEINYEAGVAMLSLPVPAKNGNAKPMKGNEMAKGKLSKSNQKILAEMRPEQRKPRGGLAAESMKLREAKGIRCRYCDALLKSKTVKKCPCCKCAEPVEKTK